jgi:putative ABC transport system permease protein
MKRIFGRLKAWWRVLIHSRALERDMHEEMRLHVEMESERLQRAHGLSRDEARREAHVRFGGLEAAKEAGRDARGRQWLDALTVDTRLGLRMLWKHRGLTFVGGFAMAAAVAVGASSFEILGQVLTPALPFDPDGRIVRVDLRAGAAGAGSLALVTGEIAPASFDTVGAFRTVHVNLAMPGGLPETIRVAEISPSGFSLAGVPAAVGRVLQPHDASASAPPVVLVSHRMWETRFGADPALVGRALKLSGTAHEVVGIMPDGFGFPIDHQFWRPFRPASVAAAGPDGPQIELFARLAPGVTAASAAAELSTLVADYQPQRAMRVPDPVVSPYTLAYVDLSEPGVAQLVRGLQLCTSLLVLVVAVNLAIVMYARTIRRIGELAVRTALGATRPRILMQLFIESLALTLTGAGVGLALVAFGLRQLQSVAETIDGLPFWIRLEVSPATMLAVVIVAVVSALIMGVFPGLRATGRSLGAHLNAIRGGQGPRLGRIWSMLVIGQVAAAVAILPAAVYMTWEVPRLQDGLGIPADRLSVVHLRVPADEAPAETERVRNLQAQMMERLAAEPGVEAITYSASVPGLGPGATIEFDPAVQTTPAVSRTASRFPIDANLLTVYQAEMAAGRRLEPADAGTDAVVVNESFAAWLVDRTAAVGARFRYASMAGQPVEEVRWHQIVGVVGDFPRIPSRLALDTPAAVYHAAAPGTINPIVISLRFSGHAPADLSVRSRQIAASIDPSLQVARALPLEDYYWQFMQVWAYVSWAMNLVTTSALVLSGAGLYAMMSFIVAQRQREIGLRIALGATARSLLLDVFSRAAVQLVIGIVVGSVLSWMVLAMAGFEPALAAGLVATVAVIAVIVGILAAIGPARQSLRIPPADALRAERV